MTSPRGFVVVPAAGLSRRMGQPKLMLPWRGSTVLAGVVGALSQPPVACCVVVARASDEPLRDEARRAGATVVSPAVDPPDMRASALVALEWIESNLHPEPDDFWMLCPADHPVLDAVFVRELLAAWETSGAQILVPTHAGRRGHPTLLRWTWATAARDLPPDVGLNSLLRGHPEEVMEYATPRESILWDLDTPEDYERLNWQLR